MKALVCGSMAYDNIMVFEGRFKDQILADKIHMLNVSFLVPALRREFGGCAGNIVYNLGLLGTPGLALAAVGEDFAPYEVWMQEHGLALDYLHRVVGAFTAQAYITTDLDDNQITAFHPGAMNHAHEQAIPADTGAGWGIVSPDGRQAMIDHAEQFAEQGVPFVFDPGQGLPMFGGDELKRFVELAAVVAVNDYEGQMLMERTGWTEATIAGRVDALIVTRGGEGSVIYRRDGTLEIPAAPVARVVDPTGCGDAYRAGLLHGLLADADWETTGRLASLMGAIKIETAGTQNHAVDTAEFVERFKSSFGYEPAL